MKKRMPVSKRLLLALYAWVAAWVAVGTASILLLHNGYLGMAFGAGSFCTAGIRVISDKRVKAEAAEWKRKAVEVIDRCQR